MTPRDRVTARVALLILVAMALFSWRRMRVGNDITHFLPSDADARLAYLSRAVADSELSRTMILAVGGPDASTASTAATELAARLRSDPEVAWLRAGVDPAAESGVYALLFPHRLDFLSDDPEHELPRRLSDAGLQSSALSARRQLASPLGSMVSRILGADPLLGFLGQLQRMQRAQGETLGLRDGQFVSRDGSYGIVFLATRHSAFDAARQGPFLRALEARFATVNRSHGGLLRLRQSSVHRIAVATETQIRADVERVSVISTVGIVLLFLLLHRSLRYLLLAALPLVAGMLMATTIGLVVFGRLHGITLAFGASLIGVCFDYPVYYINHHTLDPDPSGPLGSLARIWKGLRLGALTTMGGLAGLAWTSFPGLREIAVFSACGVLGALLATRYILPVWMPTAPIPVALQRRAARALMRAMEALRRRPALAAVLPAVAMIVCALGLPRVQWIDDTRALSTTSPALLREDDQVRELVSGVDGGRFIVALGDTEEIALQRNDALAVRLADARAEGIVGEFRSLHSVLWSRDLQLRNRAAVRGSEGLSERAAAAFVTAGFRPGAINPFGQTLASPPPSPLTYPDLMASPLADIVRPFRLIVGRQVGFLTFLSNGGDASRLQRRIANLPGVVYFDQSDFLGTTYARYRRRTLELIVAGLLTVFALIYGRYRRFRLSLTAFVPSVLAGATVLGAIGLLGFQANLMHLLGLLMVLSMGADYGIFLAETAEHPAETPDTLLSVTVACISTVLSFGLLGMSANPSLRAIGVTTGFGMVLSLLFTPVLHVLFIRRKGTPR